MKKETKIEIFFWLVVVFVFSPRILLEVYEHKLKNILTPFENNEWTVKDKDGNVIYDKLTLPYDLRWKEQETGRREWIFEKEVRTDQLKDIDDLGIVLGRVGDSDYVMFNDCLIGSTALNLKTFQEEKWGWSQLRRYSIPSECVSPISTIKYHIFKWAGPSYGVFGGPFGFGNFIEINNYTKIMDVLKYGFQFAFGIGLIFFIGVQYLFIRLLAVRRENYGTFSFLSFSVGIFLIMTSVYPFQLFSNHQFLEWILFASAIGSAIFFLKFFQQKFSIGKSLVLRIFFATSGMLFIVCLFTKNFDQAYKVYELWHPIFLLTFFIYFIRVLRLRYQRKNIYFSKYLFAYAAFLICSVHDVVVTVLGISSSYMIGSSFPFFVMVVGLTLSREYSDAFSNVEGQVVLRTNELKSALANIQEIQKLKDDQAKRFAHDIRSPLAALQVLKDFVSHQLPDDARDLFKHTIVRINDLANTALPKLIGDEAAVKLTQTSVFLWPVLDKLISEKRLEYKHLPDLTIELKNLSPIFELHATCEEIEFTRMVSNLINNSIEARKPNQSMSILISVQKIQNQIEIFLQDQGKGMPEDVISKVFDEGFTHGKKGGMGVGLKHAQKAIQSWGGKVQIDSKMGEGTEIQLHIPVSESPDWLLTKLDLSRVASLVIIDDQPFVVDAWRQKLQEVANSPALYWVQNRSAWDQSEAATLDRQNTMFLVDQDLASSTTGLDMIKEFKLIPNVVLVTGNDDDLALRKKAMDLGVKILPKALIHTIPITAKTV